MTTRTAWTTALVLDGEGPLHRQLERGLRGAIRSGRLIHDSVLSPSRELAEQLGCSRWAVTQAYGQLVAEGYLSTRVGSGTWVSWSGRTTGAVRRTGEVDRGSTYRFDLTPGIPDLRALPRTRWGEAAREAARALPTADLGHPDAAGYLPLRELLADYLQRSRGAVAAAGDVVIRSGVRAAVAQLCVDLRAAGVDRIGIEDPGWTRLRDVIEATGVRAVPVPVDSEGLRVDVFTQQQDLRAVVVTSAHQFPTGVVLSPGRRLELIEWARRTNGLILEDDYDAEFRYDRNPLTTLQGMAPEQVVLLGSVSKTLSPAIGLGWYVVRGPWRKALTRSIGPGPSTFDQATFAELLRAGAYDRQLRALRRRYQSRRQQVVAAVRRDLPGWSIDGAAAGLHLIARLPDELAAGPVVAAARRTGIRLVALSQYQVRAGGDSSGIVLGYGNLADGDVDAAIGSLARTCALVRESAR
ncbi:PLP-dependent aminotransferase family protein [Kribbella sp. NBC_00889]|uniref:MocR-like pyridoxine biosynthesis transcription factor PdxR n=1 Tax=Kribbella sp. NBC_00889 TaxID=2975974 RepID=UPI0038640F77|nr:PLP-dependent aminotransferase family protein [Kribbella sp. NBC_00889]